MFGNSRRSAHAAARPRLKTVKFCNKASEGLTWKGTRDEALALRFDRSFASYHDFTLMLGFYFLQSISSRANKQTDKIDS